MLVLGAQELEQLYDLYLWMCIYVFFMFMYFTL